MIMVETNPGFNIDARVFDPMQVANSGDPALGVLQDGGEATLWITSSEFRNRLRQFESTPFINGRWDYSQGSPPRIDSKSSIEAGVAWLFSRAFRTDYAGLFDGEAIDADGVTSNGAIVTDWKPWETAIEEYNGGGVADYLSKVREAKNLFSQWLDLYN